jgi:hypothetical protein
MNALADEYLAAIFAPWLQEELLRLTVSSVPVLALGEGKLEVQYPATFSVPYVRNTILLEIGPLASWIPYTQKRIRTYISDYFPQILEEQPTMVRVTTAERTFWEKATIAHQIVHNEKTPPTRYSRHYYDLYMLIINGIGESALGDLNLLQSVTDFKDRFYPSAGARYDLAKPGTLRLVPNKAQLKALKDDYAGMRPMFFRDPPEWDDIIRELQDLENRINENTERSLHV